MSFGIFDRGLKNDARLLDQPALGALAVVICQNRKGKEWNK
jgi:hypothetical protein